MVQSGINDILIIHEFFLCHHDRLFHVDAEESNQGAPSSTLQAEESVPVQDQFVNSTYI